MYQKRKKEQQVTLRHDLVKLLNLKTKEFFYLIHRNHSHFIKCLNDALNSERIQDHVLYLTTVSL